MDETNPYPADQPIFRALLTPHRSLGRTGFMVLIGALVAGWLVTGIFLLSYGAWPVFGFFGLDVLALYWAFKVNYRAARVREEVAVSRTSLDIRKVGVSGKQQTYSLNPFGTRFKVSRHELIGITEMSLQSRDVTVSIGSFLNPDDRESFARAFSGALAQAKSG